MLTVQFPLTAEWTPEVLEGLPNDFRYEVCEGKLVVAAAAMRVVLLSALEKEGQ